jgi:hypothetical protein
MHHIRRFGHVVQFHLYFLSHIQLQIGLCSGCCYRLPRQQGWHALTLPLPLLLLLHLASVFIVSRNSPHL